jgi:hypothetical protein
MKPGSVSVLHDGRETPTLLSEPFKFYNRCHVVSFKLVITIARKHNYHRLWWPRENLQICYVLNLFLSTAVCHIADLDIPLHWQHICTEHSIPTLIICQPISAHHPAWENGALSSQWNSWQILSLQGQTNDPLLGEEEETVTHHWSHSNIS